MALWPYTTSLPWPDVLIPRSIITEKSCNNIDIRYNAVAHLYCSAQPYVFYHILIIVFCIMLRFFNNSMMRLMCAVVVTEYCLMSSDNNEWNTECRARACGVVTNYVFVGALKCSNEISSIDTDRLAPYYSDCIFVQN